MAAGTTRAVQPHWRGWIHTVLAPLSLIASLILLILAPTVALRVACLVYLLASLTLFAVSALYHRIPWRERMMALMRRWDHANIFVLIAGSYTPIGVALLQRDDAIAMLGAVWVGAIAGICLSVFWPTAPRLLYVPIYIVLGWVALFFLPQLLQAGSALIVGLLIAEGVCYSLGALVYGFKWPDPSPTHFGYHEIFHAATAVAWTCHCVATYLAVLG